MKNATYMSTTAVCLFMMLYSVRAMSTEPNVYLSISKDAFKRSVKQVAEKFLDDEQSIEIKIDPKEFEVKNIKVLNAPTKDAFLEIYGQHLLKVDFLSPFSLDINLGEITNKIQVENFSLDVDKASGSKIPFSFYIRLNNAARVQKTFIKASLLDQNIKEYKAYAETILKLRTSAVIDKNKIDNIYSQWSEIEKEKALRAAAILDCVGAKGGAFESVGTISGPIDVTINKLEIKATGTLQILKSGESTTLQFSDIVISDNIGDQTKFNNVVDVGINPAAFDISDVMAVTYRYDEGNQQYIPTCTTLKKSSEGIKEFILGRLAIPAINDALSKAIPELLKTKTYPKIKAQLENKQIDIPGLFGLKVDSDSIFKNRKSPKEKDFVSIIKSSFESIGLSGAFNSFTVSNNRLLFGLVKSVAIDKNLMIKNESYYSYTPRKSQLRPMTSDVQLSVDSEFIANIIHHFDDLLLTRYSDKNRYPYEAIDILSDRDGNPILRLDNHDIIVKPVADNTVDIAVITNLQIYKLRKVLRLVFATSKVMDWLESKLEQTGGFLGGVACELLEEIMPDTVPFLGSCVSEAGDSANIATLNETTVLFGMDLKAEIINDANARWLKVSLPKARDLLNSSYTNNENYEEYFVFRFAKGLLVNKEFTLRFSIAGRDYSYAFWGQDALYKLILENVFNNKLPVYFTKDLTPYFRFDLPEKISVKGKVEIVDFKMLKGGEFIIDANVVDDLVSGLINKNEPFKKNR